MLEFCDSYSRPGLFHALSLRHDKVRCPVPKLCCGLSADRTHFKERENGLIQVSDLCSKGMQELRPDSWDLNIPFGSMHPNGRQIDHCQHRRPEAVCDVAS